MSLVVQNQLRILAKPKKEMTEADLFKMRSSVKDVPFFKEKNLDEKTLNNILMSAWVEHFARGKWIFKEGEAGATMYLVLHGNAHALNNNKKFEEYRREFRSDLIHLQDLISFDLEIDAKIAE